MPAISVHVGHDVDASNLLCPRLGLARGFPVRVLAKSHPTVCIACAEPQAERQKVSHRDVLLQQLQQQVGRISRQL